LLSAPNHSTTHQVWNMAAIACSPVPMQGSTFRSPLRSFTADTCERYGSEELFGDAQVRLAQWKKDFVSSAGFEAQQGLRDLCHEQAHLKDLQADLTGMQGLVAAASQLQDGGARLAEVLQSSSEAAGSRAQAVARVCDEVRELCETRRHEAEEEERKLTRQREVADAQHAEAIKLLDTYKDRLGLTINRVAPQNVRIAFSLIDECNLEREFSFTLGLSDLEGGLNLKSGYSVSESAPCVPELAKLLGELNADGSITALPRFVCAMRRAFLKQVSGAPVV